MSTESSKDKLDRVVARAQAERQQREQGYRSRALKMYPWVSAVAVRANSIAITCGADCSSPRSRPWQ